VPAKWSKQVSHAAGPQIALSDRTGVSGHMQGIALASHRDHHHAFQSFG
jgi:hypothetical protein